MRATTDREVRVVERGASLVEYAFMVALIACVCIVGLERLASAAEDRMEGADHGAAVLAPTERGATPADSGTSGDDDGGIGSGSSGGGGSTPTTTPTTAAPTTTSTTAAPTTTTTQPPTTTTAAPTTTTTRPPTTTTTAAPTTTTPPTTAAPSSPVSAATASSTRQWWDSSRNRGAWVANATFTNTSNRMAFVRVEVTLVYGNGRTEVSTETLYVPANGSAPLSVYDNPYGSGYTSPNRVTQVRFRATGGTTYSSTWQEIPLVVNGTTYTSTPPATG